MSNRYKGGIISATPPVTTGPFADDSASGAWTLEQQMQVTAAGTWPTAGNISPDAFIENLFSTYLYTGTGSTLTINNGIDLAGEGGLTINKTRSAAGFPFVWFDSTRSLANWLRSDSTNAQASNASLITSFNSNGFTVGTSNTTNDPGITYASWTFRKQPKFFDVVTYTGNGSSQNISHNLNSAPGCIIIKRTDSTSNWFTWHRKNGVAGEAITGLALNLNSSAAFTVASQQSSTTFNTGGVLDPSLAAPTVNGATYVAYLFAHDAGGFGLTGTDNVISCGSYTGNGSATGPVVTLGYEPQWLLVKCTTTGHNWILIDNMRGMPTLPLSSTYLIPNQTAAETSVNVSVTPTSTGFQLTSDYAETNASGATFIYVAIRRGLMKVPTSGATVFSATTGSGQPIVVSSPLAPDMAISRILDAANTDWNSNVSDRLRLRGNVTSSTAAEIATQSTLIFTQTQAFQGSITASPTAWYVFKRAPGFFDMVCYTGTGSARTVAHNLAAVPELMIIKSRSNGGSGYGWVTGSTYYPSWGRYIQLNTTSAVNGTNNAGPFNNTAPTASVFTVNTWTETNGSGSTYVAYLFATCPGVSKVGSYTGTATTQQINCGFTGGARFVLIKRTDSTGDWYVWDSARGIVAGNDPYLLLNSTAIQTTGTDYVDTYSAGFEISSTAPSAINASGGTFIFLAIA